MNDTVEERCALVCRLLAAAPTAGDLYALARLAGMWPSEWLDDSWPAWRIAEEVTHRASVGARGGSTQGLIVVLEMVENARGQ
jgi:hypothetical protein